MTRAETAAPEAVPPAQPASLVGQVLDGRYRILRKLGEGEIGEVYAAEDVVIGKPLAIKLLRQEIASGADAMGWLNQAARLGSIGHRNLATVTGFGRLAGGRAYLCMELLEGAALGTRAAQPMGVDRLLPILIQVGQGLAVAHARGLVHRNLKPENILVTTGPDGVDVPRLLDFGIAGVPGDGPNRMARGDRISALPFYWAPEQALGRPVDARTDIYALGAILYEGVSGTPPFQNDSFMGLLTQHIALEPEPVEWRAAGAGRALPPGLADVITRCLRKDPAQRFQTMDELVDALRQILRRAVESGGTARAPASAEGRARVVASAPAMGDAKAGAPDLRASPGGLESAGPGDVLVDLGGGLPPLAVDDNVQFTVYRPRVIAPARWYSLLAFAHLAERRPDEIGAPDPIEEVHRQAEAVLGERAAAYQSTTQDSGAAIPAEGELIFVVEIPGVEVNPPRRSLLWTEPVHREEFRIRAGARLVGTTARGRLTVFLGCIVIAELPLAVRVDATPSTAAVDHAQVRPYRKIFASYSHRDRAIVQQFEHYARALGDEYLRDAIHLRSGEVWNDRLLQMIEQADAFQLFWSHHSMRSPYVRQEYEHALSLDRPSFVRPTYWEDPMPAAEGLPPEALRRLHFQKLGGIVEQPQPIDAGGSAELPGELDETIARRRSRRRGGVRVTPPGERTGARELPAQGEPADRAASEPVQADPPPRAPGAASPDLPGTPMSLPGGRPAPPTVPGAPPDSAGHLPVSPGRRTIVAGVAPAISGDPRMQPGPMPTGSPPGPQMSPGAPAPGPSTTVMPGPSEGVVSVARTGQAVPPARGGQADLRSRAAGRPALWLALVVLALLALCFLLRGLL